VIHLSLVGIAARFDHLEPAQVLDGFVRALNGPGNSVLDGSGGGAGEFDELIDGAFHVRFSRYRRWTVNQARRTQNRSNFAPSGHRVALAPLGAMLDDPVCHGLLKPNVMTGLLGLDAFVLQDFFAFGLEMPVKQRILEQIAVREARFPFVRHNSKSKVRFPKLPAKQ
jgi:hypothetical protein